MSIKSLKRHEGWLMIDHTASPGIPADIARRIGFDPDEVGEGKKMEAATITCSHCGNAYRKNTLRIRPRGYCKKCDHYICDHCDRARALPGYIHMTARQIAEASINAAMQGTALNVASLSASKIIVP